MGGRRRGRLLAGVALLSGSAVMLEVSLGRVHAAVLGVEVGYSLWIVALLTAALGAAATAVVPGLATPEGALRRLAHLASAAAGTAVAAVVYLAYLSATKPGSRFFLPLDGPVDAHDKVVWATLLLSGAVPFALLGVAAGTALGALRGPGGPEAPRPSRAGSAFAFAVAAGAAAACPLAIAAVRFGGPRAVLAAAVAPAREAAAFAIAGRGCPTEGPDRRASAGVVTTLLLGSMVLLAGDVGEPWLKVSLDRDGVADKPAGLRWTELGVVSVDRAAGGSAWLRVDGRRWAPIVDGKVQPPSTPEDIAYALHLGRGPVLVVDAAGGRHVRLALKAGQRDIAAVVLHPGVARVMREEQRKWSGEVYDRSEVRVAVGDGRDLGPFAGERYRHILLAGPAELAAWPFDRPTVPGVATTAAALSTRNAIAAHLDRLTPEGTLTVAGAPGDLDRLLAVAAAALRARGIEVPGRSLYGCEDKGASAVVLKPAPYDKDEIATLRRSCTHHRFTEGFAPDVEPSAERAAIMGAGATGLVDALGRDVTPASDDRPLSRGAVAGWRHPAAYGALLGLLGLVVALLVPLVARPHAAEERAPREGTSAARAVGFLALAGAALGGGEIALIRAATMVLGHPSFGLAIAVPALWAAVALGSLLAGRVAPARGAARAALACVLLAVLLGAAALLLRAGLPPEALGFGVRLAATLGALGLAGALVGLGLALGLDIAGAAAPRRAGWGLGVHAAARVAGLALGTLAAATLGFGAALGGAAAALLLAAILVPAERAPG